jgi:hypothetical protein
VFSGEVHSSNNQDQTDDHKGHKFATPAQYIVQCIGQNHEQSYAGHHVSRVLLAVLFRIVSHSYGISDGSSTQGQLGALPSLKVVPLICAKKNLEKASLFLLGRDKHPHNDIPETDFCRSYALWMGPISAGKA